jgi:hypothetical protein
MKEKDQINANCDRVMNARAINQVKSNQLTSFFAVATARRLSELNEQQFPILCTDIHLSHSIWSSHNNMSTFELQQSINIHLSMVNYRNPIVLPDR